jgi:hypothetical protein
MRKINLGVLGIILLLSNLAMAGEYKMITDTVYVPQADGITKLEKHAEVCLAFLKNLEASPSFPPISSQSIRTSKRRSGRMLMYGRTGIWNCS